MTAAVTPNFRALDLNLLRIFDEVMSERSLTRAARNLALTQPAVSNALRRLRETLDDDLLRRKGQGLEPTPRAQALWPQVRSALRLLLEAVEPHGFDPAAADHSFNLAMADSTAARLLPRLAAICAAEAPDLSLHVLPLHTRDPRKQLDDGRLDLAVGYFPAVWADLTARAQVGKPAPFAHHRLYEDEYVCAMRKGHPLAARPLTVARFCAARHLLVSFSGQSYGFIDEALQVQGRRRQVVLTVDQFFSAAKVAAGSDLLTVLPSHFAATADLAKTLHTCKLPFTVAPVHVDTLWHGRHEHNGAHLWLRRAVARAAEGAAGTA